ncbi:MAG: CAP domain-containing protein [Acidobacteria bacterium]|nr:CAP domain-containing protein [Acidobacteriota bacterium]
MKKKTHLSVAFLSAIVLAATLSIDAQNLKADPSEAVSTGSKNSRLDRQRVVAAPRRDSSKFEFSESEIRAFEKQAFALINRRRAEAGLTEMAWSDDVAKVARLHSENMASLNFFGHRGADGKMVDERADQLGVKRWRAIGENIAYSRGYDDPMTLSVEKWMLSNGHRENLLNPRWKESGIGISVTADGTFYVTQVFLERR